LPLRCGQDAQQHRLSASVVRHRASLLILHISPGLRGDIWRSAPIMPIAPRHSFVVVSSGFFPLTWRHRRPITKNVPHASDSASKVSGRVASMRRTRRLGAVLLLCLPVFGAAPVPTPPSHPPANSPLLLPAGIADPAGRVGYFASASGGIEAIDLTSGKVLWQTHEAQRPVLLDGEHLLAQAG